MAPMSTLPLGKFSATISRSLGPVGGRGCAFAKTAAKATTNVITSALIIGLIKQTSLPTSRLTFLNLPTLHYTKTHPETLPAFAFFRRAYKRNRARAQRTGCVLKGNVMSPTRPGCGTYVTIKKVNRQQRNSAGWLANSARLSYAAAGRSFHVHCAHGFTRK